MLYRYAKYGLITKGPFNGATKVYFLGGIGYFNAVTMRYQEWQKLTKIFTLPCQMLDGWMLQWRISVKEDM